MREREGGANAALGGGAVQRATISRDRATALDGGGKTGAEIFAQVSAFRLSLSCFAWSFVSTFSITAKTLPFLSRMKAERAGPR